MTCEDDDKIADIQKLNGKCVRYFIQASLGLESILCFLISKRLDLASFFFSSVVLEVPSFGG